MSKLFSFFFLFLAFALTGQEEPMRVVHCTAVPKNAKVFNIYINADNDKWAGTSLGLYQIHSADNASKIPVSDDQWALLQYNCGNYPLIFSKNAIIKTDSVHGHIELSEENTITAAHYDVELQQLWVGTSQAGIYRFSRNGDQLVFMENFNTDNSKLKSNHINTIFIDRYGRQWIGTTSGVLYGDQEKWKLYERGANIQSVTAIGVDIWIMSDDVLWKADDRNRWIPGDFDLRLSRGTIRDICFDNDARLWVASEVITRYDVVADKVQVFSASDGFRSKRVTRIATDKYAALWVGTADNGIYLIEKETAMTVSCEVTQSLSCDGGQRDGALKVKIIGGVAPYSYNWEGALEGDNPKNLGAGLYTVTVTDSEGRNKTVSARIEDVDLRLTASQEQEASSENLNDGVAVAIADGGRPEYNFRWDNGETTSGAHSLKAGEHQVTVTDANGCTAIAKVEITHRPEPTLDPLNVMVSQKGKNLCVGDKNVSFEVKANGGQPPYQFQWQPELSGDKPANLAAGIYLITVTDALGYTVSQEITVAGPAPLQLGVEEDEAAADPRTRNGKATATVSGGSGNYTYIWDNGESGRQAVKLAAGKHSVTIIDDNNCEATAEVVIGEKKIPSLDASTVSSGQIIQLENLYFQADSANIEPVSEPVLNEVFKFLRSNSNIIVEVGGHTNNIPDHDYCDRLSKARAKSVAEYIISKGISANRISYEGYGKRKPIASNKSAEGRRRNQRVEIKILSTTSDG